MIPLLLWDLTWENIHFYNPLHIYLYIEPDCNSPTKTLTYISVPTCAVPNGVTLDTGHVTTSAPGAGNRFPQGDSVILTCDNSVWMFANGEVSRSFTCTGMDTISPIWTYCTGQYIYYYQCKVFFLIFFCSKNK